MVHWPCKRGQPLFFSIPSADASSSTISLHPLTAAQIPKPADLRVFEQGLSHWWDKVRLKWATEWVQYSMADCVLHKFPQILFSCWPFLISISPILLVVFLLFTLHYSLKLFLILTFSIWRAEHLLTSTPTVITGGHDKPLMLTSDQHHLTIYHTAGADLLHCNISYHQYTNIYQLHWDHQHALTFLSPLAI